LIDKSAEKIIKTVKSTGAIVSGPIPLRLNAVSIRSIVLRMSIRNRENSLRLDHTRG